MDFGLSKMENVHATVTIAGGSIGSPVYMSPEAMDGNSKVGPATDVFSVGVIFYEALTSLLPFPCKGGSSAGRTSSAQIGSNQLQLANYMHAASGGVPRPLCFASALRSDF